MDNDDDEQLRFAQLQEEEEDDIEDMNMMDIAFLIAALAIVGAEEARRLLAERRHDHRIYLVRAQLIDSARGNTPWQRLYRSRNDRAFITTMGFSVDVFELILKSGFEERWNSTAIPREDVSERTVPRPHRRSLDAAGALGLVLHYLCSTMSDVSLQQIFALIPSTVSRYNNFSLSILLKTLRRLPDASIVWPREQEEFEYLTELVVGRHSLLRGAFGSIDGLNLPVQTSDDIEIENATYNGWLKEHFISSVIVFSSQGSIIECNLNAPGSWHDSRVAQPIYQKLLTDTPDGFFLVADTAFPRGTDRIHGKIRAPMKAGQRLPSDANELADRMRFDRQLLSYRQTAEWGMRAIQGSFGRLRMPLQIGDAAGRGDLLEICMRLHNVRTRLVGINQIRSVYEPIWRDGDQAEIWDGFKDMMFSEQRARDRVSAYHIVAAFE
ncbi:hypothetical protein BD410DRAFT_821302 [Rickenella mellea]|uniref:DDE Tnp4 domain-containing protein n=1 Tax=Rickenella mellea TaxID=50990 RepID=A0A4Y7Q580_9AGAM|nr:hypothetical protein BD410DRAFT_789378 [Rickenella mellea]TDL22079.1 hypothetical protein BD410DRAFT_821302 [Rickenella mellea]